MIDDQIGDLVVKGIKINLKTLRQALSSLPAFFVKADFRAALQDVGWQGASDPELVRLLMQALKWRNVMTFDRQAKYWQLSADDGLLLANKTLPLLTAGNDLDLLTPEPKLLDLRKWDKWLDRGRLTLSSLACLSVIGALITLNASFAWELGREAYQFRLAFVVGLMALDLMRPFLVAAAFRMVVRRHYLLAATALAVALSLSPVSILSSTSILSASFLLGSELNEDEFRKATTLEALRINHARKMSEVEQAQAFWKAECARGGCGPVAKRLEQKFRHIAGEAQATLDDIVGLTKSNQGHSDLLARMVKTFQTLGLFGADRQLLLPLFLAISLELAALFGPALLLRR